jgi:hypothetical protein
MADPRRISNSEVSTWLVCQRMYRYQYDLKLEKIPTGESKLGTGIAAHEGFQAYNRARVAGATHEEALVAMDQHLMAQVGIGRAHMDDIYQAKILCSVYFAHYGDEMSQYEIIDAEQTVDLELADGFKMPLRYDWYGIHKPTGKYVLKDYKTTYDFWTYHRIKLSPQFAKYFASFRVNNMRIDECQLDQIRTRWKLVGNRTFEELFKRETITPSKAKMSSTLEQHIMASNRIVKFRELPENVREKAALPCLNWLVCKMCDFKELCAAELEQQDEVSLRLIRQTEYRQNSYDYNPDTDLTEKIESQL